MSDRTELSEALDNLPIHVEDIPGVVFQAAEKYLALLPDEDNNHDPELVERVAESLVFREELVLAALRSSVRGELMRRAVAVLDGEVSLHGRYGRLQ